MTKARFSFIRLPIAVLFSFACGAGSLELIETLMTSPRPIFEEPFRLARDEDHPLEISAAQPFSLAGYSYGDFDVYAEVELPEGGELDVVFRQVEPWMREDKSMPMYHGRFSLFRLSAVDEGPFYRSRDQALFADDMQGGQVLAPGVVASVSIEARGRKLRANVAGVAHPWCETLDDRGGISMVVRGGTGLLRSFQLTPLPRAASMSWVWAGLVSSLVAALGVMLGRRLLMVSSAMLLLPGIAWLGASFVLSLLLPEIRPAELTLIGMALAGLPISLLLILRPRALNFLLSLILLAGIWFACLSAEGEERLRSSEDARLTEHFGVNSGQGPMDALTRRLHSRTRVHRLANVVTRVFFLGGGDLFEPWPRDQPDTPGYLSLQLEVELSRELGRELESVVVPGEGASGQQQLKLVRRFYLEEFQPEALVFAVTRTSVDPNQDFAEGLVDLLDDLDKVAEESQTKIVILGSELLPAEYTDLLRSTCAARGWPLVRGLLGAEPSERLVSELQAQLITLLR